MRLVLRQQSNAFPQPWCGNPFACDGSPSGAPQKLSPAAISTNPPTLPGSRLNVPQPYRARHHDFQIKVDQRLTEKGLRFSVPTGGRWLFEAFGICTPRGRLQGMRALGFIFKRFCQNSAMVLRDAPNAIRSERIDALIVDPPAAPFGLPLQHRPVDLLFLPDLDDRALGHRAQSAAWTHRPRYHCDP